MVPNDDKERFLTELRDIPIVSVVCKRVNISKATIYRWKNEDKVFAKNMQGALRIGRYGVNDLAESKLINLMKKESMQAIRFWLEAHDKRFYKPRKALPAPPSNRTITTVALQVARPDGSYTDYEGVEHPPKSNKIYNLEDPTKDRTLP